MTNTQFYVAIALPAIMFLVNIVIILWSAKGIGDRFDERFNTVNERFNTVNERFTQMDRRFDALETDMREIRADVKLLTGKVYEMMGEKR